jgi:hypothetical protein
MINLQKANLKNAVEKARKLHPRVSVVSAAARTYSVTGSHGNHYTVHFEIKNGAGRGDWMTPNSSSFIIARDPFRAIRRGRQLFQRKFLRSQGHGPLSQDAAGNLETNLAIGAGLGA